MTEETEMEALKLILPSEDYLGQVREYRAEFLAENDSLDGCGSLERYDDPALWLAEVRRYAHPDTVPEGMAQATLFLAVRISDDRLVGMIDVRHRLNEYLELFGGNIGYSVRPLERRKGYAREMLRLALLYCRELGLERVLVTCNSSNEPSRRTILSQGGIYENTLPQPEEDETVDRYWIPLWQIKEV